LTISPLVFNLLHLSTQSRRHTHRYLALSIYHLHTSSSSPGHIEHPCITSHHNTSLRITTSPDNHRCDDNTTNNYHRHVHRISNNPSSSLPSQTLQPNLQHVATPLRDRQTHSMSTINLVRPPPFYRSDLTLGLTVLEQQKHVTAHRVFCYGASTQQPTSSCSGNRFQRCHGRSRGEFARMWWLEMFTCLRALLLLLFTEHHVRK
jgi:hypothetical protein